MDTRTGDIAWRSPLGTIPALEEKGVKNTGAPNLGGSIATAGGLVFIGATNDSRFRAFESKTGKLVWEQMLDANGHTIPITYLGKDGRQYVAIMAGGGGGYFGGTPSDSVMAFALGERPAPALVTSSGPRESGTALSVPVTLASLPEGPGKALVERSCAGACHGLQTVVGMRRDRQAWVAMVNNMLSRGATVKESEVKVIVEYLSKHYGR